MLIYLYCFFFFKQKTAYDMRISDWSSDVCSSDLYSALRFCVTLSLDSNACSIAEVGRTTSWPCVVSSSSSSPSDTAMRRSRTRPSTGTPIARATMVTCPVRGRTEERRVGTQRVSTCRSRRSTLHYNKHHSQRTNYNTISLKNESYNNNKK